MSSPAYDITRTDYEAVERFIERLAEFGRDEWLSVAALCDDTSGVQNASLHALIPRYGLNVEAWIVVDDVETAIHCSLGSRGFAPSREGASLRLARQAANEAALALLVRPLLDASEFASLYQPFASLIPVAPRKHPQPTTWRPAVVKTVPSSGMRSSTRSPSHPDYACE